MKKLLPIFISVILITVNVLTADAAENILRGVSVKSTPSAYTIELTSTTPARLTKNIVSANRVIINLKNINVSNNLSTKFDGNAVIDNVMIEPCGINDVNIMIQGNNIAYSDVVFKEPSSLERVEDSVTASFTSLWNAITQNTSSKTIQFAILAIFGLILVSEVRFIKSKYDELNLEKQEILNDIKRTADFKEYTPGYGRAGIKKPYTTPLYGTSKNMANTRAAYLRHIQTPETATLNMIMRNDNQETKILDRIINKSTPVFGTLSNININDNVPINRQANISNPLETAKLKENLKYFESMSALYRNKAGIKEMDKEMHTRLNQLY